MKINTSFRWKTPTRLQIKTPTQQQIIALSQVMIKAESTKKRPLRVKHFEKEVNNNNVEQPQKLNQIPPAKENQSSEILTLRNNSIASMKGLNEYKNLNYIDLSYNLLKEIEEINHLNLKVLIISHNKIKEIKNLPNSLKILDARANIIDRVQLQNLANLKLLNLEQNQLNSINLNGLKNLQKLYLDENKFTHFIDIPYLEKLAILSLSQNLIIKCFDQSVLSQLPSIQYINFSGNPISRFQVNENYLENIIDNQTQDNQQRLRCKSVENQKGCLDISEEIIIREAKLNIFDLCEQTPLPNMQQGKTLNFNKQLISKILKKQSEAPNYKTEVSQQGRRENRQFNQFIVKQAQINHLPDFSFLKKINKKSKQDIFKEQELNQIKIIKKAFMEGKYIDNCVTKHFVLSKCLLVYGNPINIEQVDIDSMILKYFDIEGLKSCNFFNFNKLTKITLSHNNINFLYQITNLKTIFNQLETLSIENNQICQCSYLKQFINYIFQFDERDRKLFNKFQDCKQKVITENIEIEDSLIPKIVFNHFDSQFNLYIQSLIDAINTQ